MFNIRMKRVDWSNVFFGILAFILILFVLSWFFNFKIPTAKSIGTNTENIISSNKIIINTSYAEIYSKFESLGKESAELYTSSEANRMCLHECLGLNDYSKSRIYSVKKYSFENNYIMCECKLN